MTSTSSARVESVTDRPPGQRWKALGDVPVHVALLVIGLIIAMPIFIAFFMSFTPLREIVSRANPEILPDTWTLENYGKAWSASPFGRYMVNSFVQTGVITVAQVVNRGLVCPISLGANPGFGCPVSGPGSPGLGVPPDAAVPVRVACPWVCVVSPLHLFSGSRWLRWSFRCAPLSPIS